MDRTEVFNLAFSYYNEEPREEHEWEEGDKLAKLANLYVKRAEDTVRREFPWSFLTKVLSTAELEHDTEGSELPYRYSLPADFCRMTKVLNGNGRYRMVQGRLLSENEVTEIQYVPNDATSNDLTYEMMVANRLALLLLPSQGGDGKLYNFLNGDYARMREELMRGEISARRDNIDNAETSL